jgi:asparagine synthase (glutamine-hydrolysing)
VFVSLERGWQDEARLAKESARRLHLPLKHVTSRRLTEEAFHRAVYALDEPLADASVLPLWLIAEAASERRTTYVSGHGADELLGGYPRYHFLQKARGANRFVPAGLLSDLMPTLPPNAFIRRASRYLVSMRDAQESYLSLVSVFDRGEREELYTDAMKSALYELGSSASATQYRFTEPDLTRNVLSLDLHVGLPDLLLAKCDRMASAHGITIRYPYLDDDLVAYAACLPPEIKFGVRSKPLLRIAMKGILPGPIRLRARRDFHVPLSGRIMKVIENVSAQSITPDRVDATGIFRWHTVDTIVRTASHNIYRRRQFWALLMFFAWYRNVMEA